MIIDIKSESLGLNLRQKIEVRWLQQNHYNENQGKTVWRHWRKEIGELTEYSATILHVER